jgi:hypothetical protein
VLADCLPTADTEHISTEQADFSQPDDNRQYSEISSKNLKCALSGYAVPWKDFA